MLFSEAINVLAALNFKSKWLRGNCLLLQNWYHLQTHQETFLGFITELIRQTQASSVPIDAFLFLFLRRGSMNRLAYNFWNFNKNYTMALSSHNIFLPLWNLFHFTLHLYKDPNNTARISTKPRASWQMFNSKKHQLFTFQPSEKPGVCLHAEKQNIRGIKQNSCWLQSQDFKFTLVSDILAVHCYLLLWRYYLWCNRIKNISVCVGMLAFEEKEALRLFLFLFLLI